MTDWMEMDRLDWIAMVERRLLGRNVRFKDESRLHKLIGWILFWVPAYMTRFTTTFWRRIWFPSRVSFNEWLQRDPESLYYHVCHECKHDDDSRKFPVIFEASYLVLPIGPSFKALWEWRAVKAALLARLEARGRKGVSDAYIERKVRVFTGPVYAWPWPFPKFIRRRLMRIVDSSEQPET